MNNELKGAKSIQTVLTIGLVFQIVYLVLMWLANVLQSSYMFLFTSIELEPVMDMPLLMAATLTSILYIVIYFSMQSMVQRASKGTLGLGIAVGTYAIFFYLIIPHVVAFFSNVLNARLGEKAIVVISCVRSVENIVEVFYSVAIVLLLCAYAMYWYAVKYAPEKDLRNDWVM